MIEQLRAAPSSLTAPHVAAGFPPPSLDRFSVIAPIDVGSHLQMDGSKTPSSVVWLGVDNNTGDRVALKHYTTQSLRPLYDNECEIHRELADCPRLAPVVAHDDTQLVIVKRFIEGIVVKQGAYYNSLLFAGKATHATAWSPPSTEEVRSLLLDILECVVAASRVDRFGDHALSGWAPGPIGLSCTGAAEPNVIFGDRATVVDLCNAARGKWPQGALADAAVLRALWLHRCTLGESPLVADERGDSAMIMQRRRVLYEIDPGGNCEVLRASVDAVPCTAKADPLTLMELEMATGIPIPLTTLGQDS